MQNKSSNHDFGQDILPKLLKDYSVQAYKFGNDLELDRKRFTISDDGIVVVPEGYIFE